MSPSRQQTARGASAGPEAGAYTRPQRRTRRCSAAAAYEAVDAIVEQAAEAGYECSAALMRRAQVDAGVDPDALSEADLAALAGGSGTGRGRGGPITAGSDADTIDAGPTLPSAQTQGPVGTGRTDRRG